MENGNMECTQRWGRRERPDSAHITPSQTLRLGLPHVPLIPVRVNGSLVRRSPLARNIQSALSCMRRTMSFHVNLITPLLCYPSLVNEMADSAAAPIAGSVIQLQLNPHRSCVLAHYLAHHRRAVVWRRRSVLLRSYSILERSLDMSTILAIMPSSNFRTFKLAHSAV
ncbi:hypothetical protein B0H13DRAFT_2089991 [Mycena leptocephala]|nr:hypothetical protein B0H13DRAFT_2089991 [Mycena leptocephala]